MKKFISKVLLFFACVVVMDIVFGQFFSYLRAHSKGGSTANCEYIANKATEDIIILGSSRATHHYIPQIIEDSLGVSCYNCGEEGNGIVLAYGRLNMLIARYTPKLVIYELTPSYDYGTIEPNTKYLGYLRAYYDKEGVKKIFDDFDDDLSSVKMLSKMYRNTGRLLPFLFDNIVYRDNHRGYDALNGVMDTTLEVKENSGGNEMLYDKQKIAYMEKLMVLCKSKDIKLIFMISPRYGMKEQDMTIYEPGISLCEKYNVPVYNYINCPNVSDKSEFFQDEGHMNNRGAEEYTKLICSVLKTQLHSEKE